ncbi:hypothetical protein OKA05_04960 [Luteolibacter arcticus]|uniref:DUF4304 domain-containing protein n=1 Tax=Luteolibacter arcticus TaxID=1581411 RepID=A0ABT3GF03_9BACT|nr:hypothetical protein [Luteolibacter arcticus]MCW1921890.1 hypothetical protein [Luteolibacter arcticus]
MKKLILAFALLCSVPAMGERKSKYEDYQKKAESWQKAESVDWPLVSKELGAYLTGVIAHFSANHTDAKIYGIVIETTENWDLSVYLNTEQGLVEGVALFRKNSVGYEKKTDDEIRETMGRWHYDAWKFRFYEQQCPAGNNKLNEIHYEVFDKLYDRESEKPTAAQDTADLSQHFQLACAEAIAMLEQSAELKALSKAPDFKLRFYDQNSLEWGTDKVMEKARANVKKRAGG